MSFSHRHACEDESLHVLEGPLCVAENGVDALLEAGNAACWKAVVAVRHAIFYRSDCPVRDMVIGTRAPADTISYPDVDRILHSNRWENRHCWTRLDGSSAEPSHR